jgi:hypothetical protein
VRRFLLLRGGTYTTVLGWALSSFQTRKVYTGVKIFHSIPQKQTPPHGLLVKRRLKKPACLLPADDVLFTFIYLSESEIFPNGKTPKSAHNHL